MRFSQSFEPLEPRQLLTITPAHLALANRSVAETLPVNNVYVNGNYTVTWAGLNNATTTSVSADCTTYITALLKQSYGYTSSQYSTLLGSSSPSVTTYYNDAVASKGLTGFKDIASLKVGDLFISHYEDGSTSASGHMAVIDAAPTYVGIVGGYKAYNVTIVDVSSDLHSNDTRNAIDPVTGVHDTGVGRGDLRLYTDLSGNLDHWAWGTKTTSTTYTATARPVIFAKVPAFTIGTPTKLAATATAATTVKLTWADNSAKEDGYDIERSADGATWAVVGDTTANATTYTDTLPAAGAYGYRVQAVGGSSVSLYSNTAAIDTTPVPPPVVPDVQAFQVNDGSTQRSIVRSLTVSFTVPTALDADAFALTRVLSGVSTTVSYTAATTDGGLTYVLTPTSGVEYGSLQDGVYTLAVHAASVHSVASPTTTMAGADRTYGFTRLFGDVLGTRTVNFSDFLQFQNAYGSKTGDATFNAALDYNGNGVIEFGDFLALQNRYGSTV